MYNLSVGHIYIIKSSHSKRHSIECHRSLYFVILHNHVLPPDRHSNYTFTDIQYTHPWNPFLHPTLPFSHVKQGYHTDITCDDTFQCVMNSWYGRQYHDIFFQKKIPLFPPCPPSPFHRDQHYSFSPFSLSKKDQLCVKKQHWKYSLHLRRRGPDRCQKQKTVPWCAILLYM